MRRLTRRTPGSVPVAAWLLAAAAAATTMSSCAKARPDVIGSPRCVSWKQDIGPLFSGQCQGCHTGVNPAGSYDTGTYLGVLGNGSDDVPNARAGDASSRLLAVLDPANADRVHQGLGALATTVRSWVVDCDLSYARSSIHRAGILDPASGDFHGQLIREQRYDFGRCQSCHGADFSGGTSGVSCLTCHADGPTACATCHGAIAASGSHGRHLGGGPLGKTYACGECHRVPAVYTDVGHILLADGSIDPPPAEVTLGAMAALTPAAGGVRPGPASFDPATQSCRNVYCHGAILGDSAATHPQPIWSAPGTGQADCGSCHGLPPRHTGSRPCVACHPSVVDRNNQIIAPALHIDGLVELADPAAGCIGCHGGTSGPAPPRDLSGDPSPSPSSPGVGAHQGHLAAASHLRGPIPCAECHRVPTELSSPGHFAGHGAGGDLGAGADFIEGAEVFPDPLVGAPPVGVLAASGGATPRWDHATATCASVYCHGGGAALAADASPGLDRAPLWTASGALVCGTACHGLPPQFPPHLPTMTRADCSSCHPRTIDPAGTIIISGPPGGETSFHINGALDVAE